MKRILQPILLLIVVVGMTVGIYQKLSDPNDSISENPSPSHATQQNGISEHVSTSVIVTYFTTDKRCTTCKRIESLTIETLQEQFENELKSGRIVFETHNIDRPENQHFVDQYQLAFKTVVVSVPPLSSPSKSIHWQKLDKVWELHPTPSEFKSYISQAVKDAMSHSQKS